MKAFKERAEYPPPPPVDQSAAANMATRLHLSCLATAACTASVKSTNSSKVQPSEVNIVPPDKPSGRPPSFLRPTQTQLCRFSLTQRDHQLEMKTRNESEV